MGDRVSSVVERSEPADAREGSAFATTRWTLVVGSQGRDTTLVRRALEELCQTYWRPVYAFVRRRGHAVHEAQVLTQEFFARLLASDGRKRADPARGRFGSFLLSAVKHFLANEWDKAKALKRGGDQVFVSIRTGDDTTGLGCGAGERAKSVAGLRPAMGVVGAGCGSGSDAAGTCRGREGGGVRGLEGVVCGVGGVRGGGFGVGQEGPSVGSNPVGILGRSPLRVSEG